MTRIFSALAVFAAGLLLANLVLGWIGGDYNATARRMLEARRDLAEASADVSVDAAHFEALRAVSETRYSEFLALQQWGTLHMLFGVLATLVTVLVHSIAVTYFIGTGRWCKEVVETYDLDPELIRESTRLKRQTFPWSMGGIGTVMAIAALGAASDPGTMGRDTAFWVTPHLIVSMLGVCFVGICLYQQQQAIGRNYQIIEQIMSEVRRVRLARNMD